MDSFRDLAQNVHAVTVPLSFDFYNWACMANRLGQSKPETSHSVAEVLHDHLVLELEGFDLIYRNV